MIDSWLSRIASNEKLLTSSLISMKIISMNWIFYPHIFDFMVRLREKNISSQIIYRFRWIIQQWMIVCKSISCFIWEICMSDINIGNTRHDQYETNLLSLCLASILVLLILMRFFSSPTVVVVGTHIFFSLPPSSFFLSLRFSLPLRENTLCWWRNRRRVRKKENSFSEVYIQWATSTNREQRRSSPFDGEREKKKERGKEEEDDDGHDEVCLLSFFSIPVFVSHWVNFSICLFSSIEDEHEFNLLKACCRSHV